MWNLVLLIDFQDLPQNDQVQIVQCFLVHVSCTQFKFHRHRGAWGGQQHGKALSFVSKLIPFGFPESITPSTEVGTVNILEMTSSSVLENFK